jgi:hypothetical protein
MRIALPELDPIYRYYLQLHNRLKIHAEVSYDELRLHKGQSISMKGWIISEMDKIKDKIDMETLRPYLEIKPYAKYD